MLTTARTVRPKCHWGYWGSVALCANKRPCVPPVRTHPHHAPFICCTSPEAKLAQVIGILSVELTAVGHAGRCVPQMNLNRIAAMMTGGVASNIQRKALDSGTLCSNNAPFGVPQTYCFLRFTLSRPWRMPGSEAKVQGLIELGCDRLSKQRCVQIVEVLVECTVQMPPLQSCAGVCQSAASMFRNCPTSLSGTLRGCLCSCCCVTGHGVAHSRRTPSSSFRCYILSVAPNAMLCERHLSSRTLGGGDAHHHAIRRRSRGCRRL